MNCALLSVGSSESVHASGLVISPPDMREHIQFPPFKNDHLDNPLQHLADIVTRNEAP